MPRPRPTPRPPHFITRQRKFVNIWKRKTPGGLVLPNFLTTAWPYSSTLCVIPPFFGTQTKASLSYFRYNCWPIASKTCWPWAEFPSCTKCKCWGHKMCCTNTSLSCLTSLFACCSIALAALSSPCPHAYSTCMVTRSLWPSYPWKGTKITLYSEKVGHLCGHISRTVQPCVSSLLLLVSK